MPTEKKYVCYGGWVYSNDGDQHYIKAMMLPRLYGVNPGECVFIDQSSKSPVTNGSLINKLIPLHPDSSGEYELPGRKIEQTNTETN